MMAKIYKVSFYAVDMNDEYSNRKQFESAFEYALYDLDVEVEHLEIVDSEEFEWNDDLEINMNNCLVEEFEKYFK